MTINKTYEQAKKLRKLEEEFDDLGIDIKYRKQWKTLVPNKNEIKQTFDTITSCLLKMIDDNEYPVYPTGNVKIASTLNFICDSINDKKLSSYISSLIVSFENDTGMKLKSTGYGKLNDDTNFIYLESDPSKFILDSVAETLNKMAKTNG